MRTAAHLALAFATLSLPAASLAQTETNVSAACALKNDAYTCDFASFQQVLANARTAAIETGPTDALAQDQLKKLVAAAGKTLVDRSETPDITFLLVPVDPAGVQFNSGETRLGTLRVFAHDPARSGRGNLVWAENVSGQPGTQWFAVVNRLVGQLRSRLHLKS